MKSRVLGFFLFLFVPYIAFASYFVSNLDCSVDGSKIEIKWYQPENFTNTYLYYNVYFSSTIPRYTNDSFENFLDFNLIGVVKYSTNGFTKFVFTNHQSNYYYLVLPVTNGFFVFEDFYSLVLPKISGANITNTTNFSLSNIVSIPSQFVISNKAMNITTTNLSNISVLPTSDDFDHRLGEILNDYFFKGKYEISLEKLISLRDEIYDEREKSIVSLYIARCYYAMGKKRKAIRILLQINDPEIKDIAEFWLNRFSRYF
jgi:hypothetical protein